MCKVFNKTLFTLQMVNPFHSAVRKNALNANNTTSLTCWMPSWTAPCYIWNKIQIFLWLSKHYMTWPFLFYFTWLIHILFNHHSHLSFLRMGNIQVHLYNCKAQWKTKRPLFKTYEELKNATALNWKWTLIMGSITITQVAHPWILHFHFRVFDYAFLSLELYIPSIASPLPSTTPL